MTTYGDSADRRPPLPLAARPGLAGRSEVEVAMLAPGSLWATGAAGDRDQARGLRGVSSRLPPISVLLAGEAAAAPPAGSPSTGPPPCSPGLARTGAGLGFTPLPNGHRPALLLRGRGHVPHGQLSLPGPREISDDACPCRSLGSCPPTRMAPPDRRRPRCRQLHCWNYRAQWSQLQRHCRR